MDNDETCALLCQSRNDHYLETRKVAVNCVIRKFFSIDRHLEQDSYLPLEKVESNSLCFFKYYILINKPVNYCIIPYVNADYK